MEGEITSNKAVYTRNVPEDRLQLVEIIDKSRAKVVMFIGDVDSGKTTTLTFVANELIGKGYRVAIVDSDVGQKGILPPATISLGIAGGRFSNLNEVAPVAHYFIGTTTPSQHTAETVVGVKRLVELGKSMADVVLIDTTGFISGRGFDLKRLKIEATEPDLTVFIKGKGEREGDIRRLMDSVSNLTNTFLLQRSGEVRRYDPAERREIRRVKWRKYFEGSRTVEVDLSHLRVSGTSMFSGRPLTPEERELIERIHGWVVLDGWKGKEEYAVIKAGDDGKRYYNRSVIKAVDFESLSNLLVGFIDGRGLCLGLGILKWPRLSEGKLEVLTPLSEGELAKATEIRFGRIRVTETGEELGLLMRDEL
ncbi:polyhydroxyalkanoate depolymerase [Thermococcus profundus]|uniref:polynucleotide 5'-hydroxyl-kinase n=1 Tax=Thermococcus profundus TaxID=49899 RepID=A0A2Z2MAB3_THEPR|nr:Clp1/GlmU family protein [Thermococcus profundus]ASJ02706.1 polyhydroxyalkanoate depolymerase [Thermococcus profundus]